MPLVSQTPGLTAMPSRPGGSSWATRVAVEASTLHRLYWAFDEVEPPDRAVAALRGHHGSALCRAVLIDHQVLAADADVVGTDGNVATRRDGCWG
jgi:hypothetical protein